MVLDDPNKKIISKKRPKLINLDEDGKEGDDIQTSVRKEINLLQGLDHPNIVKYIGKQLKNPNTIHIDNIQRKKILYIILEYVEKGSLEKIRKKKGGFSEVEVALYSKSTTLTNS